VFFGIPHVWTKQHANPKQLLQVQDLEANPGGLVFESHIHRDRDPKQKNKLNWKMKQVPKQKSMVPFSSSIIQSQAAAISHAALRVFFSVKPKMRQILLMSRGWHKIHQEY
jgi:hypothetical protein